MGEAKIRKQKWGSGYGLPLGLSTQTRRNLIAKNISRLISNHFETCGYHDYINSPPSYQNYQIKASSDIDQDESQIC